MRLAAPIIAILCLALAAACAIDETVDAPQDIVEPAGDIEVSADTTVDHHGDIAIQTTQLESFFGQATMRMSVLDNEHHAKISVDVLDKDGNPAIGVDVHGRFFGDFDESHIVTTDEEGAAGFYLIAPTAGGVTIGFEVEDISYSQGEQTLFGDVDVNRVVALPCIHSLPL